MVEYPVNEIIHGDCLEVMAEFPDRCFDMVLCDLPYQVTSCAWDKMIPLEPLWEQYKRVTKDNAAIVLTASQPFTTLLISSNMKMFKYCWVWEKAIGANPLLCKKRPMMYHEDIVIFYKQLPTYNPQMTKGKMRDKRIQMSGRTKSFVHGNAIHSKVGKNEYLKSNINDEYYPKSVQYFSNANQKDKVHPTQKPVALFEYLIKTYTKEGDLILDNCVGSGTTAVAAENLGCRWIGIEKEEKYVQIARERIAKERLKRSQLPLRL